MKNAAFAFRTLTLIGLGVLAVPVMAQGVYRIVGPDGRVTFSDQPPVEATARPASAAAVGAGTGGGAQLPFELRQVAARYPVTLYTSEGCAPCNSGRNLLNARGVPYNEKTISTPQDTDALKRLAGDASLPLLTIGSQQVKGYSDSEWSQYLDAAGYPKQSQLPSGYRRPAATALVSVQPAETAASRATTATARTPSAPPAIPVAPPVTNPAGIRF